jgi:hypothetical protein
MQALINYLRSKSAYPQAAANELLFGLISGLNCLGYEQVTFDDSAAIQLPNYGDYTQAVKALIVIEADATSTDKSKIARFTEDGVTTPTTAIGMPLGDLSIYETGGVIQVETQAFQASQAFQNALENFQIIGIEAGKTLTLNVQYFG